MQSPFHISYSSGALFLSLQAKKTQRKERTSRSFYFKLVQGLFKSALELFPKEKVFASTKQWKMAMLHC
jgi:hypothetical protein